MPAKLTKKALQFKDIFASLALDTDEHPNLINQLTNTEQLVSVADPTQLEGIKELKWRAMVGKDLEVAFAAQRQLGLT
ncbi:MAG: hypothetical protein HC930_17495, partial [Hydrococcus sp. SU_1_0]|nr:hypothetical protein [Hydrococcus sp. SU_1_0]